MVVVVVQDILLQMERYATAMLLRHEVQEKRQGIRRLSATAIFRGFGIK